MWHNWRAKHFRVGKESSLKLSSIAAKTIVPAGAKSNFYIRSLIIICSLMLITYTFSFLFEILRQNPSIICAIIVHKWTKISMLAKKWRCHETILFLSTQSHPQLTLSQNCYFNHTPITFSWCSIGLYMENLNCLISSLYMTYHN